MAVAAASMITMRIAIIPILVLVVLVLSFGSTWLARTGTARRGWRRLPALPLFVLGLGWVIVDRPRYR